jgi:hypothetical protein
MFTGEGNFERGRREALEGREAIERRARIEAEAASAVRNRLEKGSPSAGRRDFAGMLNAMVADAAGREMPGLAALEAIRKGQRHGYKTAADHNRSYARYERAGGEDFDRLHPKSDLRRNDIRSSDAKAQGYEPGRDVSAIEAEWLLDAARALIEAVRARARRDG